MKTGIFSGSVKTEWLLNGREMRLLETLTYTDSHGVDWVAPQRSIIDGASIPREFWILIGSPYCGKYRDASVIHDVYCKTKSRPWQQVHKVFNEMMVCSGVPDDQRQIIFRAVWFAGPRW